MKPKSQIPAFVIRVPKRRKKTTTPPCLARSQKFQRVPFQKLIAISHMLKEYFNEKQQLRKSLLKVDDGGMTGGIPRSPYASWYGMINFLSSPIHISNKPKSHPLITLLPPSRKVKGWLRSYEESNCSPVDSRVPR